MFIKKGWKSLVSLLMVALACNFTLLFNPNATRD